MSIKLNLGSGFKRIHGYLNIDSDALCKPDYVVNLENEPLPLANNSVCAIKAYHILEHIGPGFFPLMKEIYRVCEPDAIIDIRVPHPWHETFINDPTHVRPITVEGMRMLSQKYNREDFERSGSCTGLAIMHEIDFEIIEHRHIIDTFYDSIMRNNTPEQNVRLFREAINTVTETQIRLRVIK